MLGPSGDMTVRNDCLHSIVSDAAQQMDTDATPDLESRTYWTVMPTCQWLVLELSSLHSWVGLVMSAPILLIIHQMKVPLVDAAVKYESPFDGKEYIFGHEECCLTCAIEELQLDPLLHDQRGRYQT